MTDNADNLDFFYDALRNRLNGRTPRRAGTFGYSDYYADLLPWEDHFFGKTGDLVARFIPGLTVTGKDGRKTPVFKTNFRWRNRNLTGWELLTADQNAKVKAALENRYEPFSTDNMERLIRHLAARFGKTLPG